MKKKGKKKARRKSQRIALRVGVAAVVLLAVWGGISEWFVHHPRAWIAEQRTAHPFLSAPLLLLGNPLSDFTDAIGWTGHDTVYEYDMEAPSGSITFAGLPVRTGEPAPNDIRLLNRGEFIVGWSDRLRHPVWCAYHVKSEASHSTDKRPGFTKDREVASSPSPNDYKNSNYDRGHMAPNHAIATRYGEKAQKQTFMMTNVAPQTPALNRGVWRDVEHRIADFWTSRYGEIWVVVGCISDGQEKIGQTGIDVPSAYYQVILAQEGMDVRALAVLLEQNSDWGEWAARNIVTIDELEAMTGLDFNPEMPSFIQTPLEAELPTRLWPVRLRDLFRLVTQRYLR